MSGLPIALRLEFDTVHQSQAVFVTLDTDPQGILEALNLHTLPKGIISISGGAKEYPTKIEYETIALVEKVIVPLVYEHDLLVIDGGTEAGVMKIIGEVFWRVKYRHRIIIGGEEELKKQAANLRDPLLMGFVPEPKVIYPGVNRPPQDHARLDPNHFYFVMVCDAKDWGEEVECMFSFLDYLATHKQIPVVNIVANGGRITIKEVYHAVQQGWPVIVLEGSERAAEVIIAALNGASERRLADSLTEFEIARRRHEVEETVHWLSRIAKHDKISCFNLLSRPPEELQEILLCKLGLIDIDGRC